jgi:ABC-2 type transport system ATP-binding protein
MVGGRTREKDPREEHAVDGRVIEARGVRKRYGDLEALRGVDLVVERGEVVAILGPNGAGKTTLVEILEGHRTRSAGDVSVLGADPGRAGADFRARIGIVLQSSGIPMLLTCEEMLRWQGSGYPDPRPPAELLELVDLADRARSRVATLSGGQRRRLDLALGLVGRPALLFLDEPTTGFDPQARRVAWELVARLRADGVTVLLTTHAMDEAQALADRVVVVNAGLVVAEGTPGTIAAAAGEGSVLRFRLPLGMTRDALPARVARDAHEEGTQVAVRTTDPVGVLHALTSWALAEGHGLADLTVERRDLEDAYLDLVKETV